MYERFIVLNMVTTARGSRTDCSMQESTCTRHPSIVQTVIAAQAGLPCNRKEQADEIAASMRAGRN